MQAKQFILNAQPISRDAIPQSELIAHLQRVLEAAGYSPTVTLILVPDDPEDEVKQ